MYCVPKTVSYCRLHIKHYTTYMYTEDFVFAKPAGTGYSMVLLNPLLVGFLANYAQLKCIFPSEYWW